MNGYECGMCDTSPCTCKNDLRRQRIVEGKVALESLWQAFVHLPRWKMKIVKWIWPDIIHVAQNLQDYYWKGYEESNDPTD